MRDAITLRALSGAADMDIARAMFRDYQAFLNVDLCFQGFEDELAALPGGYAPPSGGIWIAEGASGVVGCVAFRPMQGQVGIAELKRLYVLDRVRGSGLGRRLCETALTVARDAGYGEVWLDTLPWLTAAIAMYRTMGFVDMPASADANTPHELVYLRLRFGSATEVDGGAMVNG